MEETISKWESSTVRNAVVGLVVAIGTFLTVVFGITFDIQPIVDALNHGWTLIPNLLMIYNFYKAFKGRINATAVIKK